MTIASSKPSFLRAVACGSPFETDDRVFHLNFGFGTVASVAGEIVSAAPAGWLVGVTWDDHSEKTHVATSHLTAARRCENLSDLAIMVLESDQSDLRTEQVMLIADAAKKRLAEVRAGRTGDDFLNLVDALLAEEDMVIADMLRVQLGQRMAPVDMLKWRIKA
jgi:D-Tyr-tRNAtyr deacylase